MKHPDVFGSLYIMSPCCLAPRGRGHEGAFRREAAVLHPSAAGNRRGVISQPENPPLYLDLPTKDGSPQPDVLAKWAANAPLAFVDQCVGNLRRYRAIAMDVGDQDRLRTDTAKRHEDLDKYGIANSFEVYPGTHTSEVADRFQNHVPS